MLQQFSPLLTVLASGPAKAMSNDPTHIPLYNDEKALIEREVEEQSVDWKRPDGSDLVFYYELESTVQWIASNGFKKVHMTILVVNTEFPTLTAHNWESNPLLRCNSFPAGCLAIPRPSPRRQRCYYFIYRASLDFRLQGVRLG